jgi:prepilin-type N-terminal cleavage/methylation domain-containing protein
MVTLRLRAGWAVERNSGLLLADCDGSREDAVTRIRTRDSQAGFSLIELMVAMVATMVIAGAVFKLMTAGNSAFRREPELSDRQQNIRLAMDIIARDIYKAGSGFPQFAQAFTDGLDAVGDMGPGGDSTDELELFRASECDSKSVCDSDGSNITTKQTFSSCEKFPGLVIVGCETDCGNDKNKNPILPPQSGLYWAHDPGNMASGSCTSGATRNGHTNFPHGKSKFSNPPGGIPFDPEWLMTGFAVRYRVNKDAEGTPNLERSMSGGEDEGGPSASAWQVIARGVEELQVEYLIGTGWQDEPGTITCGTSCNPPDQAALDSLVQRVRVRLSARASAPLLQGQTTSAVGDAVRGELVTEIAPRAAATTLGAWRGEI